LFIKTFNLSDQTESRLTYPKITIDDINHLSGCAHASQIKDLKISLCQDRVNAVLKQEQQLGYYFQSGKYWEHLSEIAKDKVYEVDCGWLKIKS